MCEWLHVASEVSEALEESAEGLGFVMALEVIGAEVLVLDAVTQHEVGGGEHGGSHGKDSFLGAAARVQA